MTPLIDERVRPNIRALKPYRSARQDHLSGTLLDANENPFGSVLHIDEQELNRYPDPFQRRLRTRLAEINRTELERVFVGVGSDEAIDLLFRIFCEPAKDNVVIAEPTYGMYRVAASVQNVAVRSCLLTKDFHLDVPALLNSVDEDTKLIFCCSPNNPTGNLLRREDILALCATKAIVVVDEAYWDFSGAHSLAEEIGNHPNLVVLRTLSKAWGLAGIRLGYVLADPSVIEWMMKVKSPYNVNALTGDAAVRALSRPDRTMEMIGFIVAERKRLAGRLAHVSGVTDVYPSDANFVLIRTRDADGMAEKLAERGIVVRNRSSEPMLSGCLRITVGTREENDRLVKEMENL